VQSACADLLERPEGFEYRGEAQFRSWLHLAVLNKLRQKHRHHAALKRRPPGGPPIAPDAGELAMCYSQALSPSRAAIAREDVERLEQAFDALSERYREVISLVRIVGLSHQEAAEAMCCTPAAVNNLLNRALVKLATEMSRPGDGSSPPRPDPGSGD
jgi:RNA polymerase sigma factor (sigma-70 family)